MAQSSPFVVPPVGGAHGVRYRGYCMTWNNYTDGDVDWLFDKIVGVGELGRIKYFICGYEGAGRTRHLQMFLCWKQPVSWYRMKCCFPKVHIEPSVGGVGAAVSYCKKEGSFVEYGTCPVAGSKRGGDALSEKWAAARKLAKAGELDEIDDKIYICHRSALTAISVENAQCSQRVLPCETVTGMWIVGRPGTGKSFLARKWYPRAYLKACNKWWDGYLPHWHVGVIMDDLEPKLAEMLSYYIKIWSDRYPFGPEVKNSHLFIRPAPFVVTSQYSIDECFPDSATNEAVSRRFRLIRMVRRGVWVEEEIPGPDPKFPLPEDPPPRNVIP